MRKWLCLAVAFFSLGCGISKEVYQAEVTNREDLERRLQAVRSQLESEARARDAAQKDLADTSEQRAKLQAELRAAHAASATLGDRLAAAQEAGNKLRSDLDVCVAARTTAEMDRDRLRAALGSEKGGRAEEAKRALELLTERDELRSRLAAERDGRAEDQKVSAEAEQERDRVRAQLAAERDARSEAQRLLETVRQERDRLRVELSGSEGARTTLDSELAAARREREALTVNLAEAVAGRALAQEALARAKAEGDGARSELDAAKRKSAEETTRRSLETDDLRQKNATLESRIARLEEETKSAEEEKRQKLTEMTSTYEGLLKGMKAEVEKGEIKISQLQDRLTVNVMDEILFDSGSARVKARGTDVLRRVGETLKAGADKAIVIEGHTDNVPLREELTRLFATNWELSTARATSVVRYLQDRVGIQAGRLSAAGFGPYRPVDTNDTPEGRRRNRRIEIKLVPLEAPLFSPPSGGGEGPKP